MMTYDQKIDQLEREGEVVNAELRQHDLPTIDPITEGVNKHLAVQTLILLRILDALERTANG